MNIISRESYLEKIAKEQDLEELDSSKSSKELDDQDELKSNRRILKLNIIEGINQLFYSVLVRG